jgi:nucleotide-sensitive chloride channel 1A
VCFNGVADLETPGTLAVTTRNVRWLHPTGDATKHLRLAFRQISMHAVSRDTGSFPRECIYMQVDGVEGVALPQREGDEEEDEEEQVTEVHIVPAAPSTRTTLALSRTPSLDCTVNRLPTAGTHPHRCPRPSAPAVDHLFQVLCDCAALNPDMDGGTLARVPLRSVR